MSKTRSTRQALLTPSRKPRGTSQSPGRWPALITIRPEPSYALTEDFLPDTDLGRPDVRARLSRHRSGGALRRTGVPGIADRPRAGPLSRRLRRGDAAPADAQPARVPRAEPDPADPFAPRPCGGAGGAHLHAPAFPARRRDRDHRQP